MMRRLHQLGWLIAAILLGAAYLIMLIGAAFAVFVFRVTSLDRMFWVIIAIWGVTLAGLLALMLMATPAAAQVIYCAPHDQLIADLAAKYGETRQTTGFDPRGIVIETYANPESGTWTLLTVTPDLTACVVATGQLFTLTTAAIGEPS